MNQRLKFSILLIFLLLFSGVDAKVYENAERKKDKKWHTLYADSTATIDKVYDFNKKSRVVKFKGSGSKDTYILGAKKGVKAWRSSDKIIRWSMNYSEDFVILLSIYTDYGYRYLIYTSGSDDGNLYYGLGVNSINGTWQTFTRNIEDDLHKFEKENQLLFVNAFLIRGSGRVDDIEMFSSLKSTR